MAFKIESKLLDACALAILSKGDTYGYEITQQFKQAIIISESTLYPVLRRLQKEKLCMTYDEPYQGRNRRYYSITDAGREQLRDYRKQWQDYKLAIDIFLEEDNESGSRGRGEPSAGRSENGRGEPITDKSANAEDEPPIRKSSGDTGKMEHQKSADKASTAAGGSDDLGSRAVRDTDRKNKNSSKKNGGGEDEQE